jgi:hypothetical protein
MNEPEKVSYANFVLPPSIVSKPDVSYLIRELEHLDNELTAAAARTKIGSTYSNDVQPSGKLHDFLEINNIAITESRVRTELIKQIKILKDHLPVIHMTFAVEADAESLSTVALWLRKSVHPQAVISVGLQPGLIAGVHVRTSNHMHDLSIRNAFKNSRGRLIEKLEALRVR